MTLSLNIDREKKTIAITRKFKILAMDVEHTHVEVATFTQADALTYIELLAKGIGKLTTTLTPSGPKQS